MVPRTLDEPQDPRMVRKQGSTWDGPHAQGWSLRPQDGPRELEGTMDGLHGANPSTAWAPLAPGSFRSPAPSIF